jgi:hypothetical protein
MRVLICLTAPPLIFPTSNSFIQLGFMHVIPGCYFWIFNGEGIVDTFTINNLLSDIFAVRISVFLVSFWR